MLVYVRVEPHGAHNGYGREDEESFHTEVRQMQDYEAGDDHKEHGATYSHPHLPAMGCFIVICHSCLEATMRGVFYHIDHRGIASLRQFVPKVSMMLTVPDCNCAFHTICAHRIE